MEKVNKKFMVSLSTIVLSPLVEDTRSIKQSFRSDQNHKVC